MADLELPPAPECERQSELVRSGRAGLIQEFLDWLLDTEQVQLYTHDQWEDAEGPWEPMPYYKSREQIMAAFFGIDLKKVEAERRALLSHLRARDARLPDRA